MKQLFHAQPGESCPPLQPTSQASTQSPPKLHAVALRDAQAAPADHASPDSVSFFRTLGRHLALRFRRLCFDEQWHVAVRKRMSGPEAFDLKDFYVLKAPRDRFYADPFLAERGERSYLFFEELVFAKRKGVISCIQFDEQGFIGSPAVVLEAKHHLSYPFLLEWEGQTYMLPESHDSGRIELFRAVELSSSLGVRWLPP